MVLGAEIDDEVRVRVEDNGVGIPAEFHEAVFELFRQGQDSTEGAGLGLALCRRYVRLMGGDIGVESRAGQGATFTFDFVAACPPGARPNWPGG